MSYTLSWGDDAKREFISEVIDLTKARMPDDPLVRLLLLQLKDTIKELRK